MIDTLISYARIKTSTKYNIETRPENYTSAKTKFVNFHKHNILPIPIQL